MSTSDDDDSHTGLTIAAIGGGALLVWLLWRGRGRGNGWGWGNSGSGASGSASRPPTPVVRILPGDRLELDGVASDLAATVARAHAAGGAEVVATGDARQGWVEDVLAALRIAGVSVGISQPPNVGADGRSQ